MTEDIWMRYSIWYFKKAFQHNTSRIVENEFYKPASQLLPQEIFTMDREQAIQQIAAIVTDLLDDDPNMLMSYLYRLDVDEGRIKVVMAYADTTDIATGLATLILDRQLARIRTQKEYQQQNKPH